MDGTTIRGQLKSSDDIVVSELPPGPFDRSHCDLHWYDVHYYGKSETVARIHEDRFLDFKKGEETRERTSFYISKTVAKAQVRVLKLLIK